MGWLGLFGSYDLKIAHRGGVSFVPSKASELRPPPPFANLGSVMQSPFWTDFADWCEITSEQEQASFFLSFSKHLIPSLHPAERVSWKICEGLISCVDSQQ